MDKTALIKEIIDKEWAFFDKVNNIGGRASCQDDNKTFYIMRGGQMSIWSEETLSSYNNDLDEAVSAGDNPLSLKYAYMMEYTEPAYYNEVLKPKLPGISEEKLFIIEEIMDIFLPAQRAFMEAYPKYASRGRAFEESANGGTSFADYSRGELKTYSENTLRCYLNDLKAICDAGDNPATLIQENTVKSYGFESLAAVEARS